MIIVSVDADVMTIFLLLKFHRIVNWARVMIDAAGKRNVNACQMMDLRTPGSIVVHGFKGEEGGLI